MSQIIVLTGCDGTGKSTLAKELIQNLGHKTFHFGPPKNMEEGKKQYFEFLDSIKDSKENYVLDRFYEGETVYSFLRGGYKIDYMREIEKEMVKHHNVLYVHVKASLETIVERTRVRGEDLIKEEYFQKILDSFDDFFKQQALPYIVVDTTNSNTEDDVQKVLDAMEKVNLIWNTIREGDCPRRDS